MISAVSGTPVTAKSWLFVDTPSVERRRMVDHQDRAYLLAAT